MSESIASALQYVSLVSERYISRLDLPVVLLHEASKNHVSVRIWSGDDVCLIVLAVSHNVGIDLRRSRKQDLTSDWKAIWILNTRQVSSSISYTIERNPRTLTEECLIQMFEFASEELNAEVFELALQILDMLRRINGYRSE